MKRVRILWTDDEIDMLKPHILFLEEKGYELCLARSGNEALDLVQSQSFDLIFLDESMPGMSGLETLVKIKNTHPQIPVVMITKNEAENIMDAAIGSQISDYLIKPVNPKQVLLVIKKHIDSKRLVAIETSHAYQSEFRNIGMQINEANTFSNWKEIYKTLVHWDLELEKSSDKSFEDILRMQKNDTNTGFAKYIKKNYLSWFAGNDTDKPLLSPNIVKHSVFPLLEKKEKVFFILIDNLRYDQWKKIFLILNEYLKIETEDIYCSILPTATHYSRNSIFAGLMPYEIEKMHSSLWVNETEEGAKNNFEKELFQLQLSRAGLKSSLHYEKILSVKDGKRIIENFNSLLNFDINILVYNFVDMLSHARTDLEMIRELANDESSYRSIVLSWFNHSYLFDMLKKLSEHPVKIVITTDHGAVRVNNPVKIIADKTSSTNLRYKQGKNLSYNPSDVFEIRSPENAHLPKMNVSTSYIFALNNDFLVYPQNYNYYAQYYKNTFQHGGVSIEEMLIPLVTLSPR